MLRNVDEQYRAPLIIGVMPLMGALATHVTTRYTDGNMRRLNFMTVIVGDSGIGKSFIRKPNELLMTPITAHDDIERDKELEYRRELRLAKNREVQPEEVVTNIRQMAPDFTKAAFLKKMADGKQEHKYTYTEEISLLSFDQPKTTQAMYCAAFDNERAGQERIHADSFTGIVNIYYNWLACTTVGGLYAFLTPPKDAASPYTNGLANRLAPVRIPYQMGARMPHFDDYTELERKTILGAAYMLEQAHGNVQCTEVSNAILKWVDDKGSEALLTADYPMDVLRKRAAVMGYTAGIIAFLLWNKRHPQYAADFATWCAEYIFSNQYALFAQKIRTEHAKETAAVDYAGYTGGSVRKLLAELTDEFSEADYIDMLIRYGKSAKYPSKNLARFADRGLIRPLGNKRYVKL